MSAVITADGIGKKYTIRHQRGDNYYLLRDVLADVAKKFGRKAMAPLGRRSQSPVHGSGTEEFWALKDVSFEIKAGERVGIIGRNGAGKSTLLKILSRITEPTEGRFSMFGRVASLLEVGTGFHPELTGRENVYLNGAILGMTRAEIRKKFDEIVAFAEVEKFLDTPVKRYSSGMYVRLAFAVAAHLEPEILIVDEVLAVGDAQFQKKCLGKMEQVGKEGRTLIFVSHQMDMIRAICNRGILLNEGKILSNDSCELVVENYIQTLGRKKNSTVFEIEEDKNLQLQIVKGKVLNKDSRPQDRFDIFDRIIIEFEYRVHKELTGVVANFELKRNGAPLFLSFDTDTDINKHGVRTPGLYKCRVELPCPLLKSGNYSITTNTGIANTCTYQRLEDILIFDVELNSRPSSLLSYADKRPGLIAMPLCWHTELIKENN